jgi:hypothetical protein
MNNGLPLSFLSPFLGGGLSFFMERLIPETILEEA